MKLGIEINGHDAFDLHPDIVKDVINSDKTGIVRGIFESKLMDDEDFPIPEDYAKHAGRPSLSERPYMTCENDGYPFLPGHSPNCNGKKVYSKDIYSKPTLCWCQWSGKSLL